jgi:hypothetical protein
VLGGGAVCKMRCFGTYKMSGIPNTFIKSLFQNPNNNNAIFKHVSGINNNVNVAVTNINKGLL